MKILPLILAGGLGSRLKELTKDVPKPLMKINNKYFIHYLLDQLITFGFKEVFISICYKADFFRKNLHRPSTTIENQTPNLTCKDNDSLPSKIKMFSSLSNIVFLFLQIC